MNRKNIPIIQKFMLFFSFIFLIGLLHSCQHEQEESIITMDKKGQSISLTGTIYPKRYNTHNNRANGHHFIVWEKGNTAKKALINTPVPDKELLDALIELGAQPGNNLTQATWDERHNPNSPEPDKQVEGTPVEIFVSWNDKSYPACQLFRDLSPEQFSIRVGGHAELIPVWRSGCITCLFSCPGGKTSNAAFTIRNQAKDHMTFWANETILPPDGTEVKIYMMLSNSESLP